MNLSSLTTLTTKELEDLVTIYSDVIATRKAQEFKRKATWVGMNVGELLDYFREHSYDTCSDSHPHNSSRARCTRCALIDIQANGCSEEFTLEGRLVWQDPGETS